MLIFSVVMLPAQNPAKNFGVINIDELKMTSYTADPVAEAVILYDVGESYFSQGNDGFRLVFERTTRIKILSKAGLDFATVEIPIYINKLVLERVEDVEGYTYNMSNGAPKITKFDPTKVFEEKNSEHWTTVKFAMPDVAEGSVIEYRYKIDSPFLFNFHDWVFQHSIPTIYSEYVARMIPFYEYVFLLQGASKFDVYKVAADNMTQHFGAASYVDNVYTFGMRNVPAFRDEDYITSVNDYIMKLDFQLATIKPPTGGAEMIMSKWPMLIQDMLKTPEFGGYLRAVSRSAPEILKGLNLDGLDENAKLESIYQYVKNNYTWDKTKDKFADLTFKEFSNRKTGNSACINLLLNALLQEAGYTVSPVLLSTRDHGKIKADYPFQQFLNYVIVMVNQQDNVLLLDATEPMSPLGLLPARCINERGIIVDKEKEQWIDLTDDLPSVLIDSMRIGFNKQFDTVFVDQRIRSSGHEALRQRIRYTENKQALVRSFIPSDHVLADSAEFEAQTELSRLFGINMSSKGPMESVGNNILVYPFKGLVFSTNPLKIPYRSYPVDMTYALTRYFYVKIQIPEGYVWKDPVKDVTLNNALVELNYKVRLLKNQLVVSGLYTFKKPVYQNNEYFDLKDAFSAIVSTFNNPIVLSRAP